MAVHFSDEEKEKLKQDKASIYEDHTDEAIKEEIKNLSWKGKLKQFQHYYLKGAIIAVVIIAMIGLQVYDAVTKADVLLFICVQGDVIDDDNVEKIQKALNEYLGYQDGKETVRLSLDGDDQQIQTFLYSGTADLLICSEENLEKWGHAGYFYSENGKDGAKGNEEVAFYSEYPEKYRRYTQYISGEDVRSNTTDKNMKASDKTQYFTGLSLEDSDKYKQLGGILPDPVIAMSNESKHPEDAEKIIRYLMDNSLKWNLKIKTASDGQNTK